MYREFLKNTYCKKVDHIFPQATCTLSENCLLTSQNRHVSTQNISEHIFAPNGGCCLCIYIKESLHRKITVSVSSIACTCMWLLRLIVHDLYWDNIIANKSQIVHLFYALHLQLWSSFPVLSFLIQSINMKIILNIYHYWNSFFKTGKHSKFNIPLPVFPSSQQFGWPWFHCRRSIHVHVYQI